MDFIALDLPGLTHIIPAKFSDDRGYFSETFREDSFQQHVGPYQFVQDNQSLSAQPGTIRGLHFQMAPHAQGKLVRCLAGSLYDVAVDLRQDSPYFGKWIAMKLSAEVGDQLWLPPGLAHGFCTLEANTIISYKVTAYYSPADDRGVAWDDPDLAIDWPPAARVDSLSAKDRNQPSFRDMQRCFSTER